MSSQQAPFFSSKLFPSAVFVYPVSAHDPAGKVVSIQLPENMRGVRFISGSAYPNPINLFEKKIPVFATDEILFPGQPIGVLTGPDQEDLGKIAEEISIVTETHDEAADRELVYKREISRGNIASEKAKAFQVIEGTFKTSGSSEPLLHPFGIAAEYSEKKKTLEMHIPTQWPGHVRESVSSATGIPGKNIIIHPLDFSVQGPLLEWVPSVLSIYAAAAAIETKGAAILELTPEELGMWINTTGECIIHISTGLDKEGSILFLDLKFTYDAGGLTPHVHRIIDREVYNAGGRYHFKHFHIAGEAWSSLWPGPKEPRMGYSLSPILFALESHLNRLAEISQQDPGELKRALLLSPGQKDIAQVPFDTALSLSALISDISEESDFPRKHGANELLKKRRVSLDREMEPLKGIGLAIGMNGNGLFGDREHINRWKCRATLNSDNTVSIETSGFLGGSGSGGLCRKRVADIFGLDPGAVHLIQDPSPMDFDSGPSSHGRNASVILDLVEKACLLIQKKRFRSPLPISVTKTTAPPRKFRWNDDTFEGNPFPRFSYGACVVEIELDPVDYLMKIRNVWLIIDTGPITNKRMAETTLRGSILSTLISCYGSRILRRMPEIHISFYSDSKITLSSSLHELPSILVPPALVSAISQASGSFFDSLPLSTEIIHKYTGDV